jgi:hypothetical protein
MSRRPLTFDSLDEAVRDAEELLASGYDKVGNWDLAQVCGHLTNWLTYPIDGFPKVPLLLRPMIWALRNTIGRPKYEKYVKERSFPAGKPTVPQSVPHPGEDAKQAVAQFGQAVKRFQEYEGPLYPSPLFGALTKNEAQALQLVHCAHHLSFLVPKMG